MAASLNEMVSVLADRVGKPFSIPLQNELKVILKYKRVMFMKRSLDKHPDQRKFYLQSFVVKLVEGSDYDAICGVDGDIDPGECQFMQTNCTLPQPIRSTAVLFDYIGAPNFRKAYTPTSPEFLDMLCHSKYTGGTAKWYYVDDKIRVYNNFQTKYIGVRGVFEYPEDINTCNCPTAGASLCYDDDQPFPAPQDLINDIMKDTLSVELRSMFPHLEGEVLVDQPTNPIAEQGQ